MLKKYSTYLALATYVVTLVIVSIVFKEQRVQSVSKEDVTLIKTNTTKQTNNETDKTDTINNPDKTE